jgi:hypothetical protein
MRHESACAGTLLELKVQRLTAIIGLPANARLLAFAKAFDYLC